eukprot:6383148-Pyramimonas_sp.AAC.1
MRREDVKDDSRNGRDTNNNSILRIWGTIAPSFGDGEQSPSLDLGDNKNPILSIWGTTRAPSFGYGESNMT